MLKVGDAVTVHWFHGGRHPEWYGKTLEVTKVGYKTVNVALDGVEIPVNFWPDELIKLPYPKDELDGYRRDAELQREEDLRDWNTERMESVRRAVSKYND